MPPFSVVVLIRDQSLKPKLNTPEVDLLFTHPLRAFLYEEPPAALFPVDSNPPSDGAIRLIPPPPTRPTTQESENSQPAKSKKPRAKLFYVTKTKKLSKEAHKAKSPDAYPPPEQPTVAPYHTYVDVAWGAAKEPVRFHRFLTGREQQNVKPIFGLTA